MRYRKAIASGNPLVIEKAQVDGELIRLTRLEAGWYLGFQPHEISILTGAGMLEPLGHPPANMPKFFSTESQAELRDNQKWLEKATDAISTYWRRKNGQKRAGRNGRTNPAPDAILSKQSRNEHKP